MRDGPACGITRNALTFVNATVIAYGRKDRRSPGILLVCNSNCVHKRQDITSMLWELKILRYLRALALSDT